jgi:hypothetical protein
MRKTIITKIILAIALTGFIGLGVSQITTDRQVKLENNIKIETTETKLKLKQLKLQELNEELDKQLNKSEKDKEKIKQLETDVGRLQSDLQAKRRKESQEAQKLARANVVKPQTVSASSGDCAREIAKYNWNQTVALNVSRAESGLRPDARGDTTLTYYQNGIRYGDSWGCFQIRYLPGRLPPSQLVNAETNVRVAYQMYQSSGWQPWSVCRTKVSCY